MMEPRGAVNVYFCPKCRVPTGTVNLSTGVTPMFALCPWCGRELMKSLFYNVKKFLDAAGFVNVTVTHVWYRPLVCTADERDYVLRGGLRVAPIGEVGRLQALWDEPPEVPSEAIAWLKERYGAPLVQG